MKTKDIQMWEDGCIEGKFLDDNGNWIFFIGEVSYDCRGDDGSFFNLESEDI